MGSESNMEYNNSRNAINIVTLEQENQRPKPLKCLPQINEWNGKVFSMCYFAGLTNKS